MAGLEVVVANGRAPNNALERTAGSHTLAAAAQRERSADGFVAERDEK